MAFDWAAFERELAAALVTVVENVISGSPDQRFYGAVLDGIYSETDGVITLPMLGVNSADALAQLPPAQQDDIRWSPPDWEFYFHDWLADERARHWEQALTAEACRDTVAHWERTFWRYLEMLVRVCKQARKTLRTAGIIDRDFLVLVFDDRHHEAWLKRCLTRRELSRHFPEFDEEAVERARVAALPEAERVAFYASRLGSFDGLINSEEAEKALRGIGEAAFPGLLPMLEVSGEAWRAAKILADIGRSDGSAVEELDAALMRLDGPDQMWVARALARLGRMDLVLRKADRLPEETVVTAVAAPFTSFQNQTSSAARLDYRVLEDFIDHYPSYVPALAAELQPGRGYCEITVEEVDEALRGLASPHLIVRQHATCVLGERRLGRGIAKRVLPQLARAAGHDPDANVRRLAILSLTWWRQDARPYTDVIRDALDDPSPSVRGAAADWLRDQGSGQAS